MTRAAALAGLDNKNTKVGTDMKTSAIRFGCPHCRVRIKAPIPLSGQQRDCPGCRRSVKVPAVIPEDASPLLVLQEQENSFSLGVAYRARG
jgi:uncharacterized protein YpuA (DUF1002 family)